MSMNTNMKLESLLLLLTCGAVTVTAFLFAPSSLGIRVGTAIFATEWDNHDTSLMDRRNLIQNSIMSASGLSFLSPAMAEVGGIGTDPAHPIVVIGAGGRTGRLCTEILADRKLYARAVTRSGRTFLQDPVLSFGAGDVTKYESIKKAIQGASGVIFVASASGTKKGGDPAHVDYLGVYNTAKACLECQVPKLVVVSAGATTRPDSVGFLGTNLLVKFLYGEKIMDYKSAGEAIVRDLYEAAPPSNSLLAYAIVRPGALSDKPSKGPDVIHISQGDIYTSEIPREDLAQVTVAALLKGRDTDFCTFEVNQMEGLGKVSIDLPDAPKELVHVHAPSYEKMLSGLNSDAVMKSNYPDLISTFRGDKIEPIEKLAKCKKTVSKVSSPFL